jgi:hypothetical protein
MGLGQDLMQEIEKFQKGFESMLWIQGMVGRIVQIQMELQTVSLGQE